MAEKLIRAFLAIELSEELKSEIKEFLKLISLPVPPSLSSAFRQIDAQNWHLTLHFFGGVGKTGIERIAKRLGTSVSGTPSFSIKLLNSGGFPSRHRARVFWVGIGEGRNETIRLKKQADEVLAKLGFEVEQRPFEPHVTIARANGAGGPLPEHIPPLRGMHSSPVKHLTLFQSTLSPEGARYSALERIPLSVSA